LGRDKTWGWRISWIFLALKLLRQSGDTKVLMFSNRIAETGIWYLTREHLSGREEEGVRGGREQDRAEGFR